jgi:hypothetical protein
MKYLLSLFLLIGWAAARGQSELHSLGRNRGDKIWDTVPPIYTGRLYISDSITMQDKDGELYIVPLDSLHGPIMDKKRWSKIPISQIFSTFLVPDYHDPISSTPRLDALEKQVQFLIRRTNELEAEIKALSGVKEDTCCCNMPPPSHSKPTISLTQK